jgi:hypothetical protein
MEADQQAAPTGQGAIDGLRVLVADLVPVGPLLLRPPTPFLFFPAPNSF